MSALDRKKNKIEDKCYSNNSYNMNSSKHINDSNGNDITVNNNDTNNDIGNSNTYNDDKNNDNSNRNTKNDNYHHDYRCNHNNYIKRNVNVNVRLKQMQLLKVVNDQKVAGLIVQAQALLAVMILVRNLFGAV